MSLPLSTLALCFITLLTAVVTASAIELRRIVYNHASEYYLLTLKNTWRFGAFVIGVKAFLAFAAFLSLGDWIPSDWRAAAASFSFGILVAFFPSLFSAAIHKLSEKYLKEEIPFSTGKFRQIMRVHFIQAMRRLRRDDVLACHNGKGYWERPNGISRQEVERRIRILYEMKKMTIASDLRRPDVLPQQYFFTDQDLYLLIDHLGRVQTRDLLHSAEFHFEIPGWNGKKERREFEGTIANRTKKVSPKDLGRCRCYDRPEVIAAVLEGRVGDEFGRLHLKFLSDSIAEDSAETDKNRDA